MNFKLIKNVIDLIEEFENQSLNKSEVSIDDFKNWIVSNNNINEANEPNWSGKENNRSPESVISTLLVHMNRYAKTYSRSAIFDSDFTSQEDFIYLINLKAFGEMSKMDLIKKNVHEKPVGMQIINRLITKDWIDQTDSEVDKRSKVIKINKKGIEILDNQMNKIRKATEVVSGDLTQNEKMELIRLLQKLDNFHQPIYNMNIEPEDLLTVASKNIK